MKYKKLHELLKKNKVEGMSVAGVGAFRFKLDEDGYSFQDRLYSDETVYAKTFLELIDMTESYIEAEYAPNAVLLLNKAMESYNEEHSKDYVEEESSETQLREEVEELKKLTRIKEDMIKCIALMREHSIKVKFEEEV